MTELSISSESLAASVLGQYSVRGKIGSGGMSDVYDAIHASLDKRVAIKTLKKRFLDDKSVVTRFLREGQLASRIRHPNIVDITDVGLIGGLPCLVMEHLEGESLDAVVRRGKEGTPIPVSELVDLLLPVIAAVDFAHEHGILHRDLKPSNIFLARAWNGDVVPKVLDFGISKLVHESAQSALTTDSAFVGTPHYASPELIRADKAADHRSDGYAMGVILYEGTTGTRPFASRGPGFVTLALAICDGGFPPPRSLNPALPEEFERVILRAMALNPEDRFPSMRALGLALLPFASERARMIWMPSFAVPAAPFVSGAETAVIPLSAMISSRSLPASSSSSYPASNGLFAPMLPSSSAAFHVIGSGMHPSMTPPAASHDRLASASYTSMSSASMQLPPAKNNPWLAAVIIAGVLALVATVGAVTLLVRSQNQEKHSTPYMPAGDVQPTTFSVQVQAIPDTATLEIDGVVAGTGRVAQTFPRDGRAHTLRVSAPGYDAMLVPFDERRTPPESIALRTSPTSASPSSTPSAKPVSTAQPPPHWVPVPTPAGARTTKKPDGKPRTDNINPWE